MDCFEATAICAFIFFQSAGGKLIINNNNNNAPLHFTTLKSNQAIRSISAMNNKLLSLQDKAKGLSYSEKQQPPNVRGGKYKGKKLSYQSFEEC